MSAVAQPSGTVTLVFTDIEGSTRLLDDLGQDGYRDALADHREVIREAFGRYGGYEVDNQGDSFFYAFTTATDAVGAVREAMAALDGGPIAVRVGVHTGEPGLDPPKYVGLDVHTAARIMAVGHGGQVVLSQSTRDLLDDSFALSDLGEHRLKDLSGPRRLYQLGAGRFAPLKTLHRTNLPVPAAAFVGRARELDELAVILREGKRLLTLIGPGGVGKTRLALQAVAEAADSFPDGVWWVPLAPLRDPGLVLSSVALALGVPEQPGRGLEETLIDVLSAGRAILLLDNLEHLLPAAAASVATLRDAGGATVVVTSRERLQLSGDHVYTVAPLAAPEAVELFFARTAALGFDAVDADSVAELCSRLDNLPLAVELAAARAGLLAPAEILSRLGGRLDRLKGGRDADPRQQTLRATIAWSHDLLDRSERELFAAFAVFTGGATIDAVEAVCNVDLDVLTSVFDKSLVRRTGERVWMLETVREFASEQFAAGSFADEVADRHAEYYLALAETLDRELHGPGQVQASNGSRPSAKTCARPSSGCSTEIRPRPSAWSLPFGGSGSCAVITRKAANCWPPRSSRLPLKRRRPGRPPSWGRDCSPRSRATMRWRWVCSRKGWRARAPPARPSPRPRRSACSRSSPGSAGTSRFVSARRRLQRPARRVTAGCSEL